MNCRQVKISRSLNVFNVIIIIIYCDLYLGHLLSRTYFDKVQKSMNDFFAEVVISHLL